jgi:hypothetical protein
MMFLYGYRVVFLFFLFAVLGMAVIVPFGIIRVAILAFTNCIWVAFYGCVDENGSAYRTFRVDEARRLEYHPYISSRSAGTLVGKSLTLSVCR